MKLNTKNGSRDFSSDSDHEFANEIPFVSNVLQFKPVFTAAEIEA